MGSEQDTRKQQELLTQQIRDLEQSLGLPLPETARQAIEQALVEARKQREAITSIGATQHIEGQATVHQAIGVNLGMVQAFFGTRPPEDGAVLLAAYLDALCAECDRLHLHRLVGRRQTGAEQGITPPLRLQQVYISLMTDGPRVLVHHRERSAAQARQLQWAMMETRTPSLVPPERVRVAEYTVKDSGLFLQEPGNFVEIAPNTRCIVKITRPELALDAIASQRRLVLLGEPGSGKSTALRYLALLLAQRLRGSNERIPGWPADVCPIPILCPLGLVAAALPAHNGSADRALAAVLGDLLEGEHGLRSGLRDHLRPALRGDGVLLLFDGLDELPTTAPEGRPGPRAVIAQALRRLAGETRARIVITSRVLPYRSKGDWQLPEQEGWVIRTIAPLAFGQVRVFVRSWYAALADSDSALTLEKTVARGEALIAALKASPALHPLVASPLLLTMLAILHYNSDEVPRDRAKLYHECVQLLLERWEPVRTPEQERAGLLERLGNLPGLDLDLLRSTLHELAFQAHDSPPDNDGRGLINGDVLENRMRRFFKTLRAPDPSGAVDTLVQVLREDAGLLLERGDAQYAFPHLTFQEYLAACHLADRRDMADLTHERWHGPDSERWHEVLRLLVGRLRQQGKLDDKLIPWLQRLSGERSGTVPKAATERRRDAVLAVLVYEELGLATLASSILDVEALIHTPLRTALLDLLAEYDPAISSADRVRAGFLLGELGDPRFPVTIEQWRREIARTRTGDASSYFCRVEAGTYWIGCTNDDPDARDEERPCHQVTFKQPFWIAHYPITNAQWKVWAKASGQPSYRANNADFNHPNQPVVSITWYMAVEFCTWLSKELGVEVRLPREVEWEAMARGQERRYYPWGDTWTDDVAAMDEEQERHGWTRAVPVGCYPAGAAACGALDVAGNVFEWTADVFQSYPGSQNPFFQDFMRVIR
ncbi:MAG TPA: SUMF1/EgtB/PvdO family nonheme iron enzyme, partial [Roseiflexaceae bacterium]|nr:SUMF1/EgtB/PvdO family nonheme iron enzyme [Roseiflexaceae bacterium]